MVTLAPPQETAPRIPGRPDGLRSGPFSRARHAREGRKGHSQHQGPVGRGVDPSPYPAAYPHLRVPPHLPTATSRSPLPARTAQQSSRDPLPGPYWARHPHRKWTAAETPRWRRDREGSLAAPLVAPPPILHARKGESSLDPRAHGREFRPQSESGRGSALKGRPRLSAGVVRANEGPKLPAKLHLRRRRTGEWLISAPITVFSMAEAGALSSQ